MQFLVLPSMIPSSRLLQLIPITALIAVKAVPDQSQRPFALGALEACPALTRDDVHIRIDTSSSMYPGPPKRSECTVIDSFFRENLSTELEGAASHDSQGNVISSALAIVRYSLIVDAYARSQTIREFLNSESVRCHVCQRITYRDS